MRKKILTGSCLFFSEYPDFKSKDVDYIILTDDVSVESKFINCHENNGQDDCFVVRIKPKKELLKFFLEQLPPLSLTSLITPEFCKETGITLEDLKLIKDQMHKRLAGYYRSYIRVIYDSYLENNDFILTDEQRDKAYYEYKKYKKALAKKEM